METNFKIGIVFNPMIQDPRLRNSLYKNEKLKERVVTSMQEVINNVMDNTFVGEGTEEDIEENIEECIDEVIDRIEEKMDEYNFESDISNEEMTTYLYPVNYIRVNIDNLNKKAHYNVKGVPLRAEQMINEFLKGYKHGESVSMFLVQLGIALKGANIMTVYIDKEGNVLDYEDDEDYYYDDDDDENDHGCNE